MNEENLICFEKLNKKHISNSHASMQATQKKNYVEELILLLEIVSDLSNKLGLEERDIIVDLLYLQFGKELKNLT